MVCRLEELLRITPLSARLLPLSTKAPAVGRNQRELNCRMVVKSLLLAVPWLPSKVSESPATGATPLQLALLDQLTVRPPPFHTGPFVMVTVTSIPAAPKA